MAVRPPATPRNYLDARAAYYAAKSEFDRTLAEFQSGATGRKELEAARSRMRRTQSTMHAQWNSLGDADRNLVRATNR